MAIPLKVLILEDYPPDLELLLYELNHAGFEPDWRQAQSEAIITACQRDLDWMRDLVHHIRHTGSLRYRDRTGIQHDVLLTLPFAEHYG